MPDNSYTPSFHAIQWLDNQLCLLDQRVLPDEETYLYLNDTESVARAITDMVVRGAPAIGITAAYGVVVAAKHCYQQYQNDWKQKIQVDLDRLAASRPTAINLFWAIDRMREVINSCEGNPVEQLLAAAKRIHEDDQQANFTMAKYGAQLLEAGSVLTHCNAGALATGGYGTALGVIRCGYASGKIDHVFADETRPWLQGARLTAWELIKDDVPVSLLSDSAAAWLMKNKKIKTIIVGSDRIAGNGDVANKIGTYSLAVNAKYHGVKFMVAAPTSTIDMSLMHGDDIPIENRDANELLHFRDTRVAAEKADAWNPVFDVTPASLVDYIVTEKGVVEQPTLEKMRALMAS